MKKYLEGLNKEQLLAVKHFGGPCMVLAGPGTGKTTVITSRICYLIDKLNVEAENILVVTFSKAAAEEMKFRFYKLAKESGIGNYNRVSFGTFHSIFFRILRQHRNYKLDNLLDEAQKFSIIKNIVRRLEFDGFDEEEQVVELINDIGYYMNTMADIEDYIPNSCRIGDFSKILESYIQYKHKAGKFDYDDMLVDCYYLLREKKNILEEIKKKYKYILVDEFQDINKVQYEVVKLISNPTNNILAVGDDDQSIYGFRGADPYIMHQYEREYKGCRSISLLSNYRSTKKILASANNVIDNNKKRFSKSLTAMSEEGDMPTLLQSEDFEDEAGIIANFIKDKVKKHFSYSDIAIIFRTNIQSRALIDALMDSNIPFVAVDKTESLYGHWVFKDILAYMKLGIDINENNELIRIINKPKRFISRLSCEKACTIGGMAINNLIYYCELNSLQIRAIEELKINLSRIRDMKPSKAIRYIRSVVGYDEYIIEYASNKGIAAAGLYEILEEAENSADKFDSLLQFIKHIEEVEAELHKKASNSTYENRVQLLTMHRAKGLEFPVVVISGVVDGLTPYIREKGDKNSIEEERRLFYVAMTRAKKELLILSPKSRYKKKTVKSRFIEEMYNYNEQLKAKTYIGQRVFHKIFNEGIIRNIVDTKNSKRATIQFEDATRELDLLTCLKNHIIKLL